jgi:hypothetical protein
MKRYGSALLYVYTSAQGAAINTAQGSPEIEVSVVQGSQVQ